MTIEVEYEEIKEMIETGTIMEGGATATLFGGGLTVTLEVWDTGRIWLTANDGARDYEGEFNPDFWYDFDQQLIHFAEELAGSSFYVE